MMEMPGLNDDTIKDTPVVGVYNCLFIMDNAPNVEALKEDNIDNKIEVVNPNGTVAVVN